MPDPYRPWTWKIPEAHESAKRQITPYGVYGIGENVGAGMSAITCGAIYNAIGKWIMDFPITPAKVLKALGMI